MNISGLDHHKRPTEVVLSRKSKRVKTKAQILRRAKVFETIQAHPIPKRKFKAKEKSVTPFTLIPNEILAHIFNFLRPWDIVKFEGLCKTHKEFTGDPVWKKMREENHLNFEFAMCAEMNERDRFFFADGLFRYYCSATQKIDVKDAKSIYGDFAFLMARFPNLRALILADLNEHSHKTAQSFSNRKFYELIYDNALAGWAGENLIQGMRVRGDNNSVFEYFKIAIKGNATGCAILGQKLNIKKSKDLSCLAADRGDSRSIEHFENGFHSKLYNENRYYPPILWRKGIHLTIEGKYPEADPFFEGAIKGYLKEGQSPHPLLLRDSANNKERLGNLPEAGNLYSWAVSLEPRLCFPDLYNAMRIRHTLNQWKEAESFADRVLAIEVFPHKERAQLFFMAGLVKLDIGLIEQRAGLVEQDADRIKNALEKFQVSKELFDKCKSLNPVSTSKIGLMINLAIVNISLEEFDEGKEYLIQALELYNSNRPDHLRIIATYYFTLEDWPQAERLYEQCIKDYSAQSKQVPMVTLQNLSYAIFKQDKIKESIQPLLQIVDSWKDTTPAYIHEIIAERYMMLERGKEKAEAHSEGEQITPAALANYAFALEMLCKWDDAIAILKQIEKNLENKLAAKIQQQMAGVYFKSGDFEKAHESYEMASETMAVERSPIPLSIIMAIVLLKRILKKSDIEDYFKKMLSYQESLGALSLQELFYFANTATSLQFWELAEDCCKKAPETDQQFFGSLAIVKKHQGLAEESAFLLKQLLDLPNDEFKIILLFNLSTAYVYQNDSVEEEICLRELMKIEGVMERIKQSFPDDFFFHFQASKLSHMLNLQEEAKNYLSKAEKEIERMLVDKEKALEQLALYKGKFLQN